jgi:pSer/pThr/pTyr-binding forkhead associated (FHA) protein
VSPVGAGIVLEDLGSTIGTVVNGKRISVPTNVRAGDMIEIGSAKIKVGQS